MDDKKMTLHERWREKLSFTFKLDEEFLYSLSAFLQQIFRHDLMFFVYGILLKLKTFLVDPWLTGKKSQKSQM